MAVGVTGTSEQLDSDAAVMSGLAPTPASAISHRRPSALPYLLLLPATVVLAVMLGYPLVRLVTLSLQEYGLPQVFGTPAPWVGLANFREILGESYFWSVLWRTVGFCLVNVVLTMGLGVLAALLLEALGNGMRLFVSASLIVAWSIPPVTATVVWQWMFDSQYGLDELGARPPGRELARRSR